jgi:hypothetical protein
MRLSRWICRSPSGRSGHDLTGADLQIDVLQGNEAAFLGLEAMPTFSTLTIAFMV